MVNGELLFLAIVIAVLVVAYWRLALAALVVLIIAVLLVGIMELGDLAGQIAFQSDTSMIEFGHTTTPHV